MRGLARAGYAEVVLTGVDLTSWGADLPGDAAAGRPGAADPGRGAGAAAPAALLDRRGRDRPDLLARSPRRRGSAAPAPVAAVGRRPDPEAHEAAALRGADALSVLRAVRRAAAGHRVRRRPHRRLPDRDRRGVREHVGVRRRLRAHVSARLSLVRAPARRLRVCRRCKAWSRTAPGGCARAASPR